MKRRKGFTIVELVIVIAVIAILAAVLIPTFSTIIRRAKDSSIIQNDRNELLENYVESVLEGEEWTTTAKDTQSVGPEDADIKMLKKDLEIFLNLIKSHITDGDNVSGHLVHQDLLNKDGYDFVGCWGSGIVRSVFSYGDKYNISFANDGLRDISQVKIRLYDDIDSSSGESVYYGLKAVEDGKDSSGNPKYDIEIVKYTEPRG